MLCANAEELGDAEGSAVMRQARSTDLSRAATRADAVGTVQPRSVGTSQVSVSSAKLGQNEYALRNQGPSQPISYSIS